MEAIIKVGGSLASNPPSLKALCRELGSISRDHSVVVVPGGGKFADVVREFDGKFELSDATADRMAVLAMDQFGIFLSNITPNSVVCDTLRKARNLSEIEVLPIFLPSRLMFRKDPLEHSWDVTSDSIAAYVAGKLNADKLILLTDVDGIFTDDPKVSSQAKLIEMTSPNNLLQWNKRTSVDKFLPKILLRIQVDSYVVNGRYPERTRRIIDGEKTTATAIKADLRFNK
jgi:aspartokinase-like uncharacterized kinase